jgi:putative DNA primase/helicase
LVDLAVRLDCAMVGITHFSKGTAGRDPTERVTGSLAFAALARIVLVAAKLPEEEGGNPGRILARSKCNIGIDTGGFGYSIEQTELDTRPGLFASRVLWGEAIDGTARELLAEAEHQDDGERSATDEAREWLTELLVAGSMKAADVQREAKQAGISERALRRAREKLGIKPHKDGFANGWRWALRRREDAPPPLEDAEDAPSQSVGAFDAGGRLRSDDDYTEVEF